jgi:phosphoribosylamine-glycine ligase
VVQAEQDAFRKWRGKGSNPELRGIVLYDALMHTGRGFKILERNSRGGNTEQVNLLTTMKDDLVDVCFRMIDGTLRGVRFSRQASVATCAVPVAYGTLDSHSQAVERIDLRRAYELEKNYGGKLRILPMDVRLEDGRTYIGTSRSVAVVGIDSTIEDAREISLSGIRELDGPLRNRTDIASKSSIEGSRDHLRSLRAARRSPGRLR